MTIPPPIQPTAPRRSPTMTGLSGNEIYCLHLKGMKPGNMVIGNSVYSMGFMGSIGAGLRNMMGGEVTQITQIIHEGRLQSYERMVKEAVSHGGLGISGVTSELRHFHGNIEFLSVASTVHAESGPNTAAEKLSFSTAHDAQELYCQLDADYRPVKFVFGNVAYSVGVSGGIFGALKSMARGEVKEFSDVFNHTRHLALQRISQEAATAGANAIVGIETTVMPFQGIHEMMMIGTAAHNPALSQLAVSPPSPTSPPFSRRAGTSRTTPSDSPPPTPLASSRSSPIITAAIAPVTSDLTCQEMWNLANMGYAPIKLVLGTAVYSLGVVGGMMAALKSFSRGEVNELTTLIYDAREHAIGLIRDEAAALGADDVVGIKTHVHDMGNLLEFMAIGTAVKKIPNIKTESAILPPQAIIVDQDTWISADQGLFGTVNAKE